MGIVSGILGLFGAGRGKQLAETITTTGNAVNQFRGFNKVGASQSSANAQNMGIAEAQNLLDGWFGGFVDALNRLPRPIIVFSMIAMFYYLFYDPDGFAYRMQALHNVPTPMWWLVNAIIIYYFGGRELHYNRKGSIPPPPPARAGNDPDGRDSLDMAPNPALDEMKAMSNLEKHQAARALTNDR